MSLREREAKRESFCFGFLERKLGLLERECV